MEDRVIKVVIPTEEEIEKLIDKMSEIMKIPKDRIKNFK